MAREAKPRARPSPIQGAHIFRDDPLKSDLHAAIEGDRLQWSYRAGIVREGDRRRQLRIGAGIEKSAKGRVPVVEDIVDEPEELNVLVQLIGGVKFATQ